MTPRNTPRNTPRVSQPRRLVAAMALAALLLAACSNPPADSPADDVRQLLVGGWLREYGQDGARVRRLLVLGDDGRFRETARVVDAAGIVTNHPGNGS